LASATDAGIAEDGLSLLAGSVFFPVEDADAALELRCIVFFWWEPCAAFWWSATGGPIMSDFEFVAASSAAFEAPPTKHAKRPVARIKTEHQLILMVMAISP
jgi:hypothetical protein